MMLESLLQMVMSSEHILHDWAGHEVQNFM